MPGIVLLLAASLIAGAPSAWANPFVGKWKLVTSKSRMPDEMRVEHKSGNTYAFDLGGGAIETIVVDGSDQPGLGDSSLSVTMQAPDTWIVERKKGGRLLLRATWNLSSDGSTLTDNYRQFETDGSTTSIDYVYQRSGHGTGFAGDWQSIKETIDPPFMMDVSLLPDGALSIADPLEHRTKNLKIDADNDQSKHESAAPGAIQGLTSSLRRVDDHTLVVTDKLNGKTRVTENLAISNKEKTLIMTVYFAGREQRPYILVFERS